MHRLLIAAALAGAPFASFAQDSPAARSLAATCANCHGTDGRSVTKEVSSLAGMPKRELLDRLKAFRDGTRPATVMHHIAKGYSEPQLEAMAEYFSRRPR